jgi:glucans biosynthesis protein C
MINRQPDRTPVRTGHNLTSERQHWPALDALRGLAMMLGVVLHAAVSYMPYRMPDLVWAIHDESIDPLFDWIFWSIHAVRLPLFFAMAGFFAVQLQESRGTKGYVIHRSRRLLLPLLGASFILLPLTFGAWAWGWLATGRCGIIDIRRMEFRPEIQTNLYGPAHLWFLEYLYIMCLLFAGVSWLRKKSRRGDVPLESPSRPRWLGAVWMPLVPAVPAAALVCLRPAVVCNFHNSFVPDPFRFSYYAIFFATGIGLARARPNIHRCFTPRSGWLLALCVPLLAINGVLLSRLLDHQLDVFGQVAFGVNYGLLASAALFGSLGVALRWGSRERPLWRYVADASYWIYLVHLPLVGLFQILLADLPFWPIVKFVLVTAVTLLIGFWTYQRYVRYTVLGHFLNGTRPKTIAISAPARHAAA